jgi:hypothetical protein
LREKAAPNRRLDVIVRAYDGGVAFRYALPKQEALDKFTVAAESTGFYFAGEASAFALNLGRWDTSNEGPYTLMPLRDIKPASLVNLPLLVELGEPKIYAALLEADLTDYAGMYVAGAEGVPNALRTRLSVAPGRPFDRAVVGRAPKSTPWRLIMVGPGPVHRAELPCPRPERAVRHRRYLLDQTRQGGLGLVVGKLRDRRALQTGHEHGHDGALHRFRGPPRVRIHVGRRRLGADVRGRAARGHPALPA